MRSLQAIVLAVSVWLCALAVPFTAEAQSGYQTIEGTRVFTVVNQPAHIATFSNACGSQTLTQAQLQAGAIPNEIIPCPRTRPGTPSLPGMGALPAPPGQVSTPTLPRPPNASTGASGATPPGGPPLGRCDPSLQAKAKINVDWVFANRGARATYGEHLQLGEAPFDAVVSAQAHNPPVQQLLRRCRAFVEAYLEQLRANPRGVCQLVGRAPTANDCQCVSVVPNGQTDATGTPYYDVTNACDAGFRVSVAFIDASVNGGGASWGPASLACKSAKSTVRPPQTFSIPSISAIDLQTPYGRHSCVCTDGICN